MRTKEEIIEIIKEELVDIRDSIDFIDDTFDMIKSDLKELKKK